MFPAMLTQIAEFTSRTWPSVFRPFFAVRSYARQIVAKIGQNRECGQMIAAADRLVCARRNEPTTVARPSCLVYAPIDASRILDVARQKYA